jgi:hypothetical protein
MHLSAYLLLQAEAEDAVLNGSAVREQVRWMTGNLLTPQSKPVCSMIVRFCWISKRIIITLHLSLLYAELLHGIP